MMREMKDLNLYKWVLEKVFIIKTKGEANKQEKEKNQNTYQIKINKY